MIRLWATSFAVVILAVLAIGFFLGQYTSGTAQPAAAPAPEDSFPPCKEKPLDHVGQPTRFEIVSNCGSVSGTVERVEFQLHDGDYRLFLDPDPQFERLLAPSNKGLLVAAIVPVDQPSVFLPTVGQHRKLPSSVPDLARPGVGERGCSAAAQLG